MKEELDKLKKQLLQQQKLASLGMLTAGIAHEIQNPLNFVINFSKMSEKALKDLVELIEDSAERLEKEDAEEMHEITEDLKENMRKIQEHGNRALSIIRSILLQSRGKENEFLPTDVAQLTHEYVWLAYHAQRSADKDFNVSITEHYQEDMPKVMVIPQDLCRAILNVVNNACYTVTERAHSGEADYSPTLDIDVHTEEQTLVITIRDNGMGMTPEVKEKLYDSFFTTKPAGKGTGLGMSITREIIIDKHHGIIDLISQPGEGTSFTFRIPV